MKEMSEDGEKVKWRDTSTALHPCSSTDSCKLIFRLQAKSEMFVLTHDGFGH